MKQMAGLRTKIRRCRDTGFGRRVIRATLNRFGFIVCLLDWAIDWLFDWLIGWLFDWLIHGLIHWLIDRLMEGLLLPVVFTIFPAFVILFVHAINNVHFYSRLQPEMKHLGAVEDLSALEFDLMSPLVCRILYTWNGRDWSCDDYSSHFRTCCPFDSVIFFCFKLHTVLVYVLFPDLFWSNQWWLLFVGSLPSIIYQSVYWRSSDLANFYE